MTNMTLQEAAEAIAVHARHIQAIQVLAAASQSIVQGEQIYRETLAKCEAMRAEVEDHKTRMREREISTEAQCQELVTTANAEVMQAQATLAQAQDELQRVEEASALARAELERVEQAVTQAKQAAAQIAAAAV